jgi:hypothetical protein
MLHDCHLRIPFRVICSARHLACGSIAVNERARSAHSSMFKGSKVQRPLPISNLEL